MAADPTCGDGRPSILVNGAWRPIPSLGESDLLSFLRDDLGLTGSKYGCGKGICGACTVLLDGDPVRPCVIPVGQAAGRSVTTVEGLAKDGSLHPVQLAFVDEHSYQCGYCTPGMVLSTVALLRRHPDPTAADITEGLDANICRCCAYPSIVRAARRAVGLGRDRDRRVTALGAPELGLCRPTRPWSSLPPRERDFFSVLGDGLVVIASREDPGSQWSTCSEAWLHVGANGSVTAFSGKVDVGQANGDAMAALVAEELRVPVEAVRLVLGDTDLCPYDLGTFGSRSMPDAAPLLGQAAAAARAVLVGIASDRWGIDRTELQAADGAIRRTAGERLGYGNLLAGQRRIEVAGVDDRPTPPSRWRVAGRAFSHGGAVAVVTGSAWFPSDVARPDMLWGRVVKPPAVGATLGAVDTSRADSVPGVRIVHEDGFVGAVGDDDATAEETVGLVGAAWVRERQPAENELVTHLRTHPSAQRGWGEGFDDECGDVDGALETAPVLLEHTYTTAYIAHAPLETRVAVAEWNNDELTVWTGTQRPFAVREQLAIEFGIDEEEVRVVAPRAGGGFGGKHTADVAVEAARLARAAGRPVKVRWGRGEEFQHAYARPASVIDIRSGAGPDGTLIGWDFLNVNSGSAGISSPYRCPNFRVRFEPAASPLPQGSYRALAATANHFARESQIDELAEHVGVDPLEFRLRHIADERLRAVLVVCAERAGWARTARGGRVGLGIAAGLEKDARVATCAEVRVDAAGAIAVTGIVTAIDCGAIVDPVNLRNQVEGATVMGLGGALFERLNFDCGVVQQTTLADYRVPRFSDVPPIEVVLVDRRDVAAAGAGETPIIAVAPAIASAIAAATGERRRALPLAREAA